MLGQRGWLFLLSVILPLADLGHAGETVSSVSSAALPSSSARSELSAPELKRAYSYVAEYKRLPVYNFGLGKRVPRLYSKRTPDYGEEDYIEDVAEQLDGSDVIPSVADDDEGIWDPEKRSRSYSFGIGKRARSYSFGLGKRARSYSFGLGKRAKSYNFGLGKRAERKLYSFGLGKRMATGRRYSFGIGKRSDPETDGAWEDDDVWGATPGDNLRKRELAPDELKEVAEVGTQSEGSEQVHHIKKRSATEYNADQQPDDDLNRLLELDNEPVEEDELDRSARAMRYNFGLGKRGALSKQYSFGLGKRAPRQYSFGLGKRPSSATSYDFGKRGPNRQYSSGLGRRSMQYNFGIGKRGISEPEGETSGTPNPVEA